MELKFFFGILIAFFILVEHILDSFIIVNIFHGAERFLENFVNHTDGWLIMPLENS
jgi:hypothetical protein